MTTPSDDQLDDLGARLRQGITRSAREEYSALRRYLDTFRLKLEGNCVYSRPTGTWPLEQSALKPWWQNCFAGQTCPCRI